MRRVAIVVGALVCAMVSVIVGDVGGVAGAASPPTAVVMAAPSVPFGAFDLGAAPSGQRFSLAVALAPRDPAGLAAFAQAVSDPSSPLYGHYLAKGQLGPRFGPTLAQVAAVRSALVRAGLTPGKLFADRMILPVSGTAAQLQTAFGVQMHSYRLASGQDVAASATAVRVPTSIASSVQAVLGLDGFDQAVSGLAPATPTAPHALNTASVGPQPCTAAQTEANKGFWTQPNVAQAYGYTPFYAVSDLGAGQTVALVELEPYSSSDVAKFQSCYGTDASVTKKTVNGGPTDNNPNVEDAFDIENVIGLAPDAAIEVYEGPNNGEGWAPILQQIASDDVAREVSNSWYNCEPAQGDSALNATNTADESLNAEGVSVFQVSGDEGSAECDSAQSPSLWNVADAGSQPNSTGVGGTNLEILNNPPWVAPTESAWNHSGGGISGFWTMPSYQKGPGVDNSYSSGTPCGAPSKKLCREVPDVSADAGSGGYVIYAGGKWIAEGGTSGAAPTWAALAALINDQGSCVKKPIGFINSKLYSDAESTPADFNDITVGANDKGEASLEGHYPATTGYDMATGLGSPEGANIEHSLCGTLLWSPQANETNPVSESPAVATNGGTIYVAYQNGGNVYWQSFNGLTWTSPTEITIGGVPIATGHSPSLADNDGALSVAWVDSSTGDVDVSTLSGSTWSAAQQVGDGQAVSNHPPSLAAIGGSLTIVWDDASTGDIELSAQNSGGGWTSENAIPGATSPNGPALTSMNDVGEVIAWQTSSDTIDYVTALFGFSSVKTIPGGTSSGPTLAVLGTRLYVGYKGKTTDNIYYTSAVGSDGSFGSWATQGKVNQAQTAVSPAFAVTGPTLTALWTGESSNELWYSAADAPQK